MSESEQLPLMFPKSWPIPWPTGSQSLYLALLESKRRRRAAAPAGEGEDGR